MIPIIIFMLFVHYHELGHYLLGHLGTDVSQLNRRRYDIKPGKESDQEVEPAPDKETYLYYSTQRPIDIGTYPNSYFNRPVHMDLYFTRQQVPGESFQAWKLVPMEITT